MDKSDINTLFPISPINLDAVTLAVPSSGGTARPVPLAPKRIKDHATNVGLLIPADHEIPSTTMSVVTDDEAKKHNATAVELSPPLVTPLLRRTDRALKDKDGNSVGGGSYRWWLYGATAGQVHDLCRRTKANHRFYHRSASWGGRLGCAATAFLLDSKFDGYANGRALVVTPLHALRALPDPTKATKVHVVFGYEDGLGNGWGQEVTLVYEVVDVLGRGSDLTTNEDDWAVLILNEDRAVLENANEFRKGISLSRQQLGDEDKLVVIGHMLTLPKTFGRGAVVNVEPHVFSHTCDSLGGSSGAPLLRRGARGSFEVVGMSVSGGHLRSTATGGAEPIPIGDQAEQFYGQNCALIIPPRKNWPDSFAEIEAPVADEGHHPGKTHKFSLPAATLKSTTAQRVRTTKADKHVHDVKLTADQLRQLRWGHAITTRSEPAGSGHTHGIVITPLLPR